MSGNILVTFSLVLLPGISPYFYYEPSKDSLKNLDGKEKVIYEFSDSSGDYEFEIKIC